MIRKTHRHAWLAALALLFAASAEPLRAESGAEGWLRYAPLTKHEKENYQQFPGSVVVLGDSPVLASAQQELILGVHGMLGRALKTSSASSKASIILGTRTSLRAAHISLALERRIHGDGYFLTARNKQIFVTAETDRGVLYGVFALLSKIARAENISTLNEVQEPSAPLRWVNQWDNLDGRIERGYAGPSIFFENGRVRADLTRAGEYARLLASVGINGCTINNVNADPRILSEDFLPQLARVADAFRPWGVQLSISVDMSSPKALHDLDTFDPLAPEVANWWRKKADAIYHAIPDFGGFVVKADSEGRLGPSVYHRSAADGANVIAQSLKPHGGVLFYRAFVYNHHLDWRDLKNDRARAAYDTFHPLDGKFEDNVIIQIKNGPIDFQVREPVSPLFGGLPHTNEGIELQITQEYTGQQRHLVFLVPMWKEVLDFDLHLKDHATPLKDVVSGKIFQRPTGAVVGVANVGLDANWLASPLAMANLYGFGRLAWNPNLTSAQIADEWTRLTFGNDPLVDSTITQLQLVSWRAYENYTGPLGIGTLTNIVGPHYGPGPESSEQNGWGQWHRADHDGVGMDRTVATGTGYIAQYSPEVQRQYESLQGCPDDLLLFFHHVPYTHVLHSGKTVIQSLYDSHYEGAALAEQNVAEWQRLKGHMDDDRYAAVLSRLQYQASHAIVWRDAINDWFYRLSGIADQKGRVGNHPGRVEAEDLQLQNYKPFEVIPWEASSKGRAIECPEPAQQCAATLRFSGAPGSYELDVEYFDQNNGASKFRVYVAGQLLDQWTADDHFPTTKPDADSSLRRQIFNVALHPGDEIRIEGIPDQGERAPLDYIELNATKPQ